MSRSGYSTDLTDWEMIKWRGGVASAIRGRRGQELLRQMAVALDAMPDRRLIADDLVDAEGRACALGTVFLARGMPTHGVDPHDRETIAAALGVAPALVAEVAFENDEGSWGVETPERRWKRMRAWVEAQIIAG